MFSIIKALFYGLSAIVIVAFILANRAEITLSLIALPEVTVPLYVPIVLAFALGLAIGLLYAMRGAIAHSIALRRAKRASRVANG